MKTALEEKNFFMPNNLVYFIFAGIFLMFAGVITRGFFSSIYQLFFVFFALFTLSLPLLNLRFFDRLYAQFSIKNLLLANVSVSFVLFYFFNDDSYLICKEASENIFILKTIAFAVFLLYFAKINGKSKIFSILIGHFVEYKFVYLMAIAVLMRIITMVSLPNPSIDVFYVTNEAVDNLVSGRNPYSAVYTSPFPGLYSNPGYLPMIILLNLPGRLFLGDVRFGYLIAHMLIAAIIYLLLRKKYCADKSMIELPILMFMYLPNSLFILSQAWIEPLLLLILFLFALVFVERKTGYLTFALLGVFLSLKQNNFPFFLLTLSSFNITFKKAATALSAAFLTVLPFLIWDIQSFINATVLYFFSFKVQAFSISINSLYAIIFNKEIPYHISFAVISLVIIFLALRTRKNSLIDYIHSSIIAMLSIFFIMWGYANYYYFISGGLVLLITLGLLLSSPEESKLSNKIRQPDILKNN